MNEWGWWRIMVGVVDIVARIVARMVTTTTTMVMVLLLVGMDNDDVGGRDGLFVVASAWCFVLYCLFYCIRQT